MTETEWTLATGLRKAAIHLLIWSLICLAIWVVAVLAVTPLLEMLPDASRGARRLQGLVMLLGAGPVAWVCVRWLFEQMQESAGFGSLLLSALSIVFVWALALAGVIVANAIRTPQVDNGLFWVGLGAIATVWILYETYADR